MFNIMLIPTTQAVHQLRAVYAMGINRIIITAIPVCELKQVNSINNPKCVMCTKLSSDNK